MYTAIKLGHTDDKQTQRRIVTIKFKDISIPHEFVKDFSFRLIDTLDVMKHTVLSYLDEINATPEILANGAVNTTITPNTPTFPTQAELEKQVWDLDVARVKKAQELLDCGVVFSAGQLATLTTLREKVATNFKALYLG